MNCMKHIGMIVLAVAGLVLSVPSAAQDSRATIIGTLRDSSGAAVTGIDVKAINTETNVVITGRVDGSGNYQIPYLNPGIYDVTVETPGFEKYLREGFELRTGDRATIDIVLKVGKVTEEVVVGGDAPLLDMQSESIGTVIDQKSVQELPISGGNVAMLAVLAPLVNYLGNANNGGSYNVSSDISVNGMRGYNTEFLIDGSPAMQNGTTAYQPPVDMIQQARTLVSVYDASYAHSAGGYHTVATRAGTNAFHGTLYEYHTDNVLLSLSYFQHAALRSDDPSQLCPSDPANPVRCAKGKVVSNRFGGSLGGPIIIPKLYNGRDKAFWFAAYERSPNTSSSPNYGEQFTVPTVAERAGDFAALLAYGCAASTGGVSTTVVGKCADGSTNYEQLIDPNTGKFFATMPGQNAIPQSELQTPGAKIAMNYLQYYPLPNAPCQGAQCQNNYFRTESGNGVTESFSSRLDYVFSPRDRLFGRFNHADGASYLSGAFDNAATGLLSANHANAMAVDNVFTFSASLLMDARYSFTRELSPTVSQPRTNLASLGVPADLISQIPSDLVSFPRIYIDSGFYPILGTYQTNPSLTTNYHAANVDFTKQKDRHTVRFGGQFRVYQNNNTNVTASTYPVPSLTFADTLTTVDAVASPVTVEGGGLASFLMGIPTAGSMFKLANYAITSKYMSGYVQDDFRATARLTFNMGLLYEYETAPTERYNRLVRGFNTTDPNPINGVATANYTANWSAEQTADPAHYLPAPSNFHVNGGLQYAGVNGVPRGLWSTDKNNFAPRVGAAYRLTNTTVLRGGYGVYYMPKGADRMSNQNPADMPAPVQTGFQQGTSFTVQGTATIVSRLDNPFPSGLIQPTGSSLGLGTSLGQAITFLPLHIVNPMIQRATFGLQHQFPKGILIEASYAGTFAHNLYTIRQLNAIPNQYLSTLPTRDTTGIANLGHSITNPFLPSIGAGTSLSNPTLPISQLLLAYPQFSTVSYPQDNGSSNYNAGFVRGEKRFSSGWSLQGNYTWSKYLQNTEYLNGGDANPDHLISDLDIPEKFALTGIYDIPVGRGRHYGSHWNKYVGAVVGGWQVSMTWYGQSGTPIAFPDSIYIGDFHHITLPNSKKTVAKWFNTDTTVDTNGNLVAGWEKREPSQRLDDLRTFPLRLPGVRTQGQNDMNASLMKYFALPHQARLQIRVEGYNALNHSQFAAPNATPDNSLFGQISAVQSVARQIFFVGKIFF